jgi:hypothetical protein
VAEGLTRRILAREVTGALARVAREANKAKTTGSPLILIDRIGNPGLKEVFSNGFKRANQKDQQGNSKARHETS